MRFSTAICLSLLLLVAGATATTAQVKTLPLAPEETHLTLIEREANALTYRAAVGELAALEVATEQGSFTRLMIPGFHASHVEGAPELPMMNRLVEIPHGATARIEILSVESRTLDLAAAGIEHALFPAQPSMPKNVAPEDWPFVYDANAYETERVARELVTIVPTGRLRAVDLGRLELAPVEYYPRDQRITVHQEIEFRVVFDGVDVAAGDELKARTHSPFFEPLYQRIDGYRGLHDSYPDLVRDVVTMVIVTDPMFETQLQEFVEWKTARGFHTILAVRGTPEVGSTKEEIRDYIHDLYLNATPELPAPSFVLFVGDIAQMPTWTLDGDATDRPYCDVEEDLVPDIYYGRFSATSTTQLQAILDKTLMYDQFAMPDPAYLEEVVMIAGMDSGHGSTWGNGQINYGTENYFNAAHGIYSHTYLYPESGGHAADIIQNVSDGVGYINYTAHGSTTSWSNPYFSQSDIDGLQNYGEYCLAVGNCCLTSTYDIGECFAESWLRAEGKGAIGYIGGSNSTYWDEDYWWGVGHTSSITANPTYEESGLGAYDGLFHDHGEAMDQWYVTNDAIIFSGNLAVMESGSGLTTYYWNIYNLMGDPSLATYLGVPDENPVVHPQTVFTTWTSIAIEAVPGSYVGLSKDGELIGAGTVGEAGTLDLPLWADPLTPGYAQLVVMAQNREPHITELNVIVPAQVTIDPAAIDANVTTDVTVGVFEYDGVTPKPGIEVWADGLEYESTHAFTDASGHCTISVTYPYGPALDIVGQDPAEPWELFRESLPVNAQALTMPDLYVTTEIGLADTLALNLPGTLHGRVGEVGVTLWAFLNDELLDSVVGLDLSVTPTATGTVTGILALDGYDLYTENFPVIEAFGTLAGHVDASGNPADGAIVRGYDALAELAFTATANSQGDYDVGEEILVAPYTITAEYFGYLPWEQEYFLNYGANTLDIDLVPAPSGVLTGTITASGSGDPLQATVRVYRSDTMELYTETVSDPATGAYTTSALPYFDYVVAVRASQHIPATVTITVDDGTIVRDFALEPTIGNLLLIDDSAAERACPAKYDAKTGGLLAAGGPRAQGSKSAADLEADLETLGYSVTLETLAGTDPATWEDYDLLIACGGDNHDPFDNASFRSALIDYVEVGGHLLIEGGEVAYDYQGEADFAGTVLHVTDWTADQSGNVGIAMPAHYIASVPNVISGPITMGYDDYGDADACDVAADADLVGNWTSYTSKGSVIAYDPNPAPEGGQIVFYAFNYSAMDAAVRGDLLQNSIVWLMTTELGDCAVSGTAQLAGEEDHANIRVEAVPNGGYVYTDSQGAYELAGLFAGPYTIQASKSGWSTEVSEVTLTSGQHLTDVDFLLTRVYEEEACESPGLSIPDNVPAGVTDETAIGIDAAIEAVEVYIDITHTYIGDLIVELTSPEGTTVRLHNRSGGSAEDLVGWYPADLDPAESLDAWVGENAQGTWTLLVSDNAGIDTGTLNDWCVRVTYSGGASDIAGDPRPATLALWQNRPNPVQSQTAIRFDLPRTTEVDLAVFDVSGRRVATLARGTLAAGRYTENWNGYDDGGRRLGNTVYFYRLKTDAQTLTRKMMMLR